MRTVSIVILVVLSVGNLTGCSSKERGAIPEVSRSQFETPPDDIRNYRYCEIIPIFRVRATFYVEVYNTIDLNDCPADLWSALDGEALSALYGATDVKMNGPRFWVINEVSSDGDTATGKTVDFGGIEMVQRAVIETKLWEGAVGSSFYTENEVQRTTTYTYHAGSMVYELTSPVGEIFRMQSYAQIVDPSLTISDLDTLGDRLSLPTGWTFSAKILTQESKLVADGVAHVINDDLGNSYQKVTGGLAVSPIQ